MIGILLFALVGCARPTITGSIVDDQGAPVVAARVAIEGTTLSTLSDDKGGYSLPFVPGLFHMTVQKDGYLSLGRQLLVTEGRTLPLAPLSLVARAAGATVTALTATGPVAVDLATPDATPNLGLADLPSLALPADTWGLVVVQSKDERNALDRLFCDNHTPAEDAQLLHLRWKGVEMRRDWGRPVAVPINRWTVADAVQATATVVEGSDPVSFILRPNATLEDGAYALPVQVERPATGGGTLRWAAFTVGKVEKPADEPVNLDDFEGD